VPEAHSHYVTDKNGNQGVISTRGVVDPDNVCVELDSGATVMVPRNGLVADGDGNYHVGFTFEGLPPMPVHPAHMLLSQGESGSEPAPVPPAMPTPPPPSTAGARSSSTSGVETSFNEVPVAQPDVSTSPTTISTGSGISGSREESRVVVPRIEEQVHVEKREVETGGFRIHKSVEEHPELIQTSLEIEEVTVEHVPINRMVDTPAEMRMEGDTTIIPIMEEVLVVEKRLMLREEIRLTKTRKRVMSSQRVMVLHERVDIDRLGGTSVPSKPEHPG